MGAMSHYFENDAALKHDLHELRFVIRQKEYRLKTDAGVFSKDRLDSGTRVLLETVLEEEKDPASVLDLGCGLGPVGVVLKDQWDTRLTMIDVNQRAVDLAKENLKRYGLQADLRCQDGIQEGEYACIVFNPPIRAGKKVIYRLFQEAIEHLSQEGHLWIVMRKQHGAQSAIQYLEDLGCLVRKVKRDKGFWVFVAQKKSTGSSRA